MPQSSCSLVYMESQAVYREDTKPHKANRHVVEIDIGDASPEESRWWAAILAPGQGWRATVAIQQNTSSSPWSIRLESGPEFLLVQKARGLLSPHQPPSFLEASIYLRKFCLRHGIVDQSYSALASVLLIPSLNSRPSLQLPALRISNRKYVPGSSNDFVDDQLNNDSIHHEQYIDRLLALSCYTRGIRPMLFSVFFEPRIECNAVTPWLQGALGAIDQLAGNNLYITSRMCMEREPKVAYLWLGSLILGQHEKLIRFGQIPIDVHSAVWSGTVQSFIQQHISKPLMEDRSVSRADECRLLYLSQSGIHARFPVCQWKPFGAAPAENLDIEGILWECENDKSEFQSSQTSVSKPVPEHSPSNDTIDASPTQVSYGALNHEDEIVSENATRSILGWLRFDGHAKHEKELWKHEWLDLSDSEEDLEGSLASSISSPKAKSHVESWLSDINS